MGWAYPARSSHADSEPVEVCAVLHVASFLLARTRLGLEGEERGEWGGKQFFLCVC